MEIFNVGDASVNRYLLVSPTHRLLVDTGFPDTVHQLGRDMRQTGYKVSEIDYLLVTHFHIDHAGAVQELKDQGVKCILFDVQESGIDPMEKMAIGKWKYTMLKRNDNRVMNTGDARKFLHQIGISGQAISTPGHSSDCISLLLDTGEAFTGDLYAEPLLTYEDQEQKVSWLILKRAGAKKIYPGHGKPYLLG